MFSRWILWNLFLAVIPVALAAILYWGLGGKSKTTRLPLLVNLLLAVAWLVFLPNTCYLLTEWRHLLLNPRWTPLIEGPDPQIMFSLARHALFFLVYSASGVLLFVLSIRPLELWLRARGQRFWLYAPFLFFFTSLGVYMGLIPRLNSWDIINRPKSVMNIAIHAFTDTKLLISISVFAVLLWMLYEAGDIWVEGVASRLKR